MTCSICVKEILINENFVSFPAENKQTHLCCFVKEIGQEIENNSFAFSMTGAKYSAKEVFHKTVTVKCNHKKI